MKKFIVIIVILITLTGAYFIFNQKQTNPVNVLAEYFDKVNQGKYEEMYEFLNEESKAKITKEEFIKRNKNIYQGIDLVNIEIFNKETSFESQRKVKISYSETMKLEKAEISFENTAYLIKEGEGEYKIDWSSNLIFPNLNEEDKVKVSPFSTAKRGRILDRNGVVLAENRKSIICGNCTSKI